MYVPHTTDTEECISCRKVTSLDCSMLKSKVLMSWRELEGRENAGFFSLYIHRLEDDHRRVSLRSFVL